MRTFQTEVDESATPITVCSAWVRFECSWLQFAAPAHRLINVDHVYAPFVRDQQLGSGVIRNCSMPAQVVTTKRRAHAAAEQSSGRQLPIAAIGALVTF